MHTYDWLKSRTIGRNSRKQKQNHEHEHEP